MGQPWGSRVCHWLWFHWCQRKRGLDRSSRVSGEGDRGHWAAALAVQWLLAGTSRAVLSRSPRKGLGHRGPLDLRPRPRSPAPRLRGRPSPACPAARPRPARGGQRATAQPGRRRPASCIAVLTEADSRSHPPLSDTYVDRGGGQSQKDSSKELTNVRNYNAFSYVVT